MANTDIDNNALTSYIKTLKFSLYKTVALSDGYMLPIICASLGFVYGVVLCFLNGAWSDVSDKMISVPDLIIAVGLAYVATRCWRNDSMLSNIILVFMGGYCVSTAICFFFMCLVPVFFNLLVSIVSPTPHIFALTYLGLLYLNL